MSSKLTVAFVLWTCVFILAGFFLGITMDKPELVEIPEPPPRPMECINGCVVGIVQGRFRSGLESMPRKRWNRIVAQCWETCNKPFDEMDGGAW